MSAVGVLDEDDSDNEDTDGISVQIDKMENKCAMLNDDRNIWIQLNKVNQKLHQANEEKTNMTMEQRN